MEIQKKYKDEETKGRKFSIRKRKKLTLCCMASGVILMMTPYGVPTGPDDYMTVFYQPYTTSFFCVSYGSNWFPVATVVLSVIVLIMLVVDYIKRKNNMRKYVLVLLSICIIASPLSWILYGITYTITLVGAFVFFLHIITFILVTKH